MPKKITKEGLNDAKEFADKVISAWQKYRDDLKDYIVAFDAAAEQSTTPPGGPPKPPGIP